MAYGLSRAEFLRVFTGLAGVAALAPFSAAWAQPAAPVGAREMVLGAETAPVTVIEYASLTCPHCAQFHATIFPTLKAEYIDTGKVKFIYRDFPLDEPGLRASQMARCKGTPEAFFGFIDILFKTQSKWATPKWAENLEQLAKLGGVGSDAFKACMTDKALADYVMQQRLDGDKQFKITGTPTIVVNNKNIGSPNTPDELKKQIDPLLKK